MSHPEFFEGVRCLLVDRNDKPKWAWAKPADIKPADVEKFFRPFADKTRELAI